MVSSVVCRTGSKDILTRILTQLTLGGSTKLSILQTWAAAR